MVRGGGLPYKAELPCLSLNGSIKIVHELFRGKKATDPLVINTLEVMMVVIERNRMTEPNPVEVLDLLEVMYIPLRKDKKYLAG